MVRIYGPADTRDRGRHRQPSTCSTPAASSSTSGWSPPSRPAPGISLRTGCFCNPGAGEGAFDLTGGRCAGSRRWGAQTVDEYLTRLGMPTGGAVRVSLGLASNRADVDRFLAFLDGTYRDRPAVTDGLKPRLRC